MLNKCSKVTVHINFLVTSRNPNFKSDQDYLRTLTGLLRIPRKKHRLHRHFHS